MMLQQNVVSLKLLRLAYSGGGGGFVKKKTGENSRYAADVIR